MASKTQRIIDAALKRGDAALSEHDSKKLLAAYGVPVSKERLVGTAAAARAAAGRIGYPVVLKACAADQAHKTETGLIAVNLGTQKALSAAFAELKARAGADYDGAFLVQEMVKGAREIMIGMHRDAQFGPAVMFGLGGIFTEILQDVVFRIAPLRKRDALEMTRGIRAHRILDAVRGMPAVDLDSLTRSLMAVGKLALDHPDIAEIDINPLIVRGDKPVAVDALVVLSATAPGR
ncbi:MAG: acetate--CoA ligase family protein [Alphaproteobacteria bacterium]